MNIRREKGLINPTPGKRVLMGVFAAAAISVLTAAPARAAFTLYASDTVEAHANYTKAGTAWANQLAVTGPYRSLTAFDLPTGADVFLYGSNGSDSGFDNTWRYTAGFGGSKLVQAGTYRVTAYSGVGDLSPGRQAYQTFEVKLMTLAGVEWSGGGIIKNVITPYVDPNPQHAIDGLEIWVPSTVEYVIPEGHALIGSEFTWAFRGTKINDAYGYAFSIDNAFVDFAPLAPEIGIVNTPPIDFGPVLLNMTNDVTVTVTNSGSAVLNITNFTFSGTDAARFSVLSPTGSVAAAAAT
jgi:hypothetical protein